jgi:non-ribosomal peptide synthetase component F
MQQPSKSAICSWDLTNEMTYGELDAVSSRLADRLLNSGVEKGSFVPFILDRSWTTVITVIAILKAGGACVPMDHSHPTAYRNEIIRKTGALAVVTCPKHAHLLKGCAPRIVLVDELSMDRQDPTQAIRLPEVSASDRSYVLFTSGSTGTPKGIVLDHRCLSTSIIHHGPALGIDSDSRKSKLLPIASCFIEE